METDRIDPEIERFFQDLDSLPHEALYDVPFDPTFFTPDGLSHSSSLTYFPPLPPLDEEELASIPKQHADNNATDRELEDLRSQIHTLSQEVVALQSKLKHLKSYVNSLHPWMLEVTEALDKLGEAPPSATDLEFTIDKDG